MPLGVIIHPSFRRNAVSAASWRPAPCRSAPGILAPWCLGRALPVHPESFSHALSPRRSPPPPQPVLFARCVPTVRPSGPPGSSADISRRQTLERRSRPTARPTYGWRQHPGRGAFSGYRWRPGGRSAGRPCRWGYRVGGERTGSSQSGRRWYQTRHVAAWLAASSVKRTPRLHHHHHLRLVRASFDSWTCVRNTSESVSLVQ